MTSNKFTPTSIAYRLKIVVLMIIFFKFLSCRERSDYTKSICFPYKVSDKIVKRTEYLQKFGIISSRINADIEYHVLPDASMESYITIEGPENFVDGINCTSIYDSYYNQNEISLSYKRCVTKNKNPKLIVHIYAHEVFQVNIFNGSFISKDTIRSDDGFIDFSLFESNSMDIVCNVPIINIFIPSSAHFICHGFADSTYINIYSADVNKMTELLNLEGLKYRSLYYYVHTEQSFVGPAAIYAGCPDTIYYDIHMRNFNLYYQGDPVLIDRHGSPFFTLFKKD